MYYHISENKNQESILRHGLKTTTPVHTSDEQRSKERGIYVFTDLSELEEILFWLCGSGAAGKRWSTFRIDTSRLPLKRDDAFESAYIVLSDIPPSRIKYIGNAHDVALKHEYNKAAGTLRRRGSLTYYLCGKSRKTKTITTLSGLKKHWGITELRKQKS